MAKPPQSPEAATSRAGRFRAFSGSRAPSMHIHVCMYRYVGMYSCMYIYIDCIIYSHMCTATCPAVNTSIHAYIYMHMCIHSVYI